MKGLPIFVLLLAGSILTAAPAPKLFADPVSYTGHYDQLIPQYRYVPEQKRFWNPRTQQFE